MYLFTTPRSPQDSADATQNTAERATGKRTSRFCLLGNIEPETQGPDTGRFTMSYRCRSLPTTQWGRILRVLRGRKSSEINYLGHHHQDSTR